MGRIVSRDSCIKEKKKSKANWPYLVVERKFQLVYRSRGF